MVSKFVSVPRIIKSIFTGTEIMFIMFNFSDCFGTFELDCFHMILLSVKQSRDVFIRSVLASFRFKIMNFPFYDISPTVKNYCTNFVYISTQQMKFVF
jgi:hypothetical protein